MDPSEGLERTISRTCPAPTVPVSRSTGELASRLCRPGLLLLFPWFLSRSMLADHSPGMIRPKLRPLCRVPPAVLSAAEARTLDSLHRLSRIFLQYSC